MPYSNPAKPVVLPPGRARLATNPAPTGPMSPANTIGTLRVACCSATTIGVVLAKMTSGASAISPIVSANAFDIACTPARVDPHVATDCPAPLLQSLKERRNAGLSFRIVCGKVRDNPDAPHALRLLRARRERRRGCRTAEQRDERAAFHGDLALASIASAASACHPASLIFTRATSIILTPTTMRSACADASPARTSSISSSALNPFANISASVQPSGEAGSSSRAAAVGLGAAATAVRVQHGVSGGSGTWLDNSRIPRRCGYRDYASIDFAELGGHGKFSKVGI